MTALETLRRHLDDTRPAPRPPADGISAFPSGFPELDAVLPGGGIPRGRLTELRARPGQGRTTLLRSVVGATLAAGRWVAIVDAQRTLAPQDWAPLLEAARRAREATGWAPGRDDPTLPRLAVVRPPDPERAAWCADVLLRAGAFALVVLDGAPALPRATVVRLTRLAHDRQVALVLAGDDAPGAVPPVGAALRLGVSLAGEADPAPVRERTRVLALVPRGVRPPRIDAGDDTGGDPPRPAPRPRRRQALVVQVTKGATPATVRLPYAVPAGRPLVRHPLPPDRKAAARSVAPRR